MVWSTLLYLNNRPTCSFYSGVFLLCHFVGILVAPIPSHFHQEHILLQVCLWLYALMCNIQGYSVCIPMFYSFLCYTWSHCHRQNKTHIGIYYQSVLSPVLFRMKSPTSELWYWESLSLTSTQTWMKLEFCYYIRILLNRLETSSKV